MKYLYIILVIYWLQMIFCATIHFIRDTKAPNNLKDYLKLTFMPYLIWCIFKRIDIDN